MISIKHAASVLLSAILLPLSLCSSAQVVDVSGCRTIQDSQKRFECYESLAVPETTADKSAPEERQIQPVRANKSAAVAQPGEKRQAANPVASENRNLDGFGKKSATENAQLVENQRGKTELIDTIASIEKRLPTLSLITLKSGQKWLQMISKRYPLQEGDEVRIYPSRFGAAYRLTATRMSGYIQVERVD